MRLVIGKSLYFPVWHILGDHRGRDWLGWLANAFLMRDECINGFGLEINWMISKLYWRIDKLLLGVGTEEEREQIYRLKDAISSHR